MTAAARVLYCREYENDLEEQSTTPPPLPTAADVACDAAAGGFNGCTGTRYVCHRISMSIIDHHTLHNNTPHGDDEEQSHHLVVVFNFPQDSLADSDYYEC